MSSKTHYSRRLNPTTIYSVLWLNPHSTALLLSISCARTSNALTRLRIWRVHSIFCWVHSGTHSSCTLLECGGARLRLLNLFGWLSNTHHWCWSFYARQLKLRPISTHPRVWSRNWHLRRRLVQHWLVLHRIKNLGIQILVGCLQMCSELTLHRLGYPTDP